MLVFKHIYYKSYIFSTFYLTLSFTSSHFNIIKYFAIIYHIKIGRRHNMVVSKKAPAKKTTARKSLKKASKATTRKAAPKKSTKKAGKKMVKKPVKK